jgi:hypothetical protein
VSLYVPALVARPVAASVMLEASIAWTTVCAPLAGRRGGATRPVILPSATGAAPACAAHATTMQAATAVGPRVRIAGVWSPGRPSETWKPLVFAYGTRDGATETSTLTSGVATATLP